MDAFLERFLSRGKFEFSIFEIQRLVVFRSNNVGTSYWSTFEYLVGMHFFFLSCSLRSVMYYGALQYVLCVV